MGGGAFIGGKQNKDFIVVAELALPIVEQVMPKADLPRARLDYYKRLMF